MKTLNVQYFILNNTKIINNSHRNARFKKGLQDIDWPTTADDRGGGESLNGGLLDDIYPVFIPPVKIS